MVRAAATSPAIAKRSALFGLRPQPPPGISGHARLLARPAYARLVAAEPVLRRLIPVLIAIFLIIVGVTRVVELYGLKVERELRARDTVGLIATMIADRLARSSDSVATLATGSAANALANVLPTGAVADGRRVYLTDPHGIVVAAVPDPSDIGTALTQVLSDAQPLTTFGERA